MRKFLTILILSLSVVAFLAAVAVADEDKPAKAVAGEEKPAKAAADEGKPAHEFVGSKKCKGCHKDVYASWIETTHAKTFDVLSDEEKKNEACISCHSTGTLADGTLIEGVGCEACHGPGKDYKSAKIMSRKKWAADPETHKKMAIDAGLIYPVEATCTTCHKEEGNKNFKPFDFEKRKGTSHPVVKK